MCKRFRVAGICHPGFGIILKSFCLEEFGVRPHAIDRRANASLTSGHHFLLGKTPAPWPDLPGEIAPEVYCPTAVPCAKVWPSKDEFCAGGIGVDRAKARSTMPSNIGIRDSAATGCWISVKPRSQRCVFSRAGSAIIVGLLIQLYVSQMNSEMIYDVVSTS